MSGAVTACSGLHDMLFSEALERVAAVMPGLQLSCQLVLLRPTAGRGASGKLHTAPSARCNR